MRTCGRCGAQNAVMVRCLSCRCWLCEACEWSHDCPAAPEPKTPADPTDAAALLAWGRDILARNDLHRQMLDAGASLLSNVERMKATREAQRGQRS